MSSSSSNTFGRRSFSVGLLAGVAGLGVLGLPRGVRAMGTRVLIIGGSTMEGGLGLFLERHLKEGGYDVQRRGKKSSGLARPDFFDWPKEASKLHAGFAPDLSVVMFGGNDGMSLHRARKEDPKWIRPDDPRWDVEYRRRVAAMADILAPGPEQLVWIGMPPVKDAKLNGRIQRMNAAFLAEMEARANGHFIETWDLLGRDGEYTDRIEIEGKRVKVRAGDGVHLTPAGAKFMVGHVAARLGSVV
jgi:hypothetical protein